MPIASPLAVSGCILWLDASQLSLSDGDPVSTWDDHSGGGHDGTSAGGLRPIYKTNIVNGLPALRCGTSSESRVTFSNFIVASAGTGFVVWKLTTEPGSGNAIGSPWGNWGGSGSNDHFPFSGDSNVYSDWGSNARKNTGNPSASLAAFNICTIRSATSDWKMWFNGTLHFSTATNTVGFSIAPKIAGDGLYYIDGYIAEMIMYDTALSSTDRQEVDFYLATKYGISGPTDPTPGGTGFTQAIIIA